MWGDSGDASDSDLTAAVRAGDADAFNALFRRHFAAACRFAGRFTSPDDVQDRVVEGFARVYQQLRRGKGPDSNFRAYLYTAIRNAQTDALRRPGLTEVPLDDLQRDEASEDNVEEEAISRVADDTPIMRAFAALQPTWQRVLWHTIVLGETNNEVAASIGSNPNAVAVLAFRAREGLRQAYLAEHVKASPDRECGKVAHHLPRFVRGQLNTRHSHSVEAHLHGCVHCRNAVADLGKINQNLAALLGPVLILAGPGALGGSIVAQSPSPSQAAVVTKAALVGVGTIAAIAAVIALAPESTVPRSSPTSSPATIMYTDTPVSRRPATRRPKPAATSHLEGAATPSGSPQPSESAPAPSRTPKTAPSTVQLPEARSALGDPRVTVFGSDQVRQAQVIIDVTPADQGSVEVRVTNAQTLSVDAEGVSCSRAKIDSAIAVSTCTFTAGAPPTFTMTVRVTFAVPTANISGSVVLKPDNRAVTFRSTS